MKRLAAVLLTVFAAPIALAAPCAGFTDVDDSSGFCVNVEWMKNRGITLGLTSTLYSPNTPVTRLQMAAFMYRLGFQNALLRGGNAFGGTAVLGTTDNHAVEVRASGERVMHFEPTTGTPNLIGGNAANSVVGGVRGATIAGGGAVTATEPIADVDYPNRVTDDYGMVGGGLGNRAGNDGGNTSDAIFATVAGGAINMASAVGATVGGGESNTANGAFGTIAGGGVNTAGEYASVGGGGTNSAEGIGSAIPGGHANLASGSYSFAAGIRANAAHDGCFIWGDSSAPLSYTSCFANNEFVARSLGGFYFWTSGSDDNSYAGARLAPGTGAWAAYSDRNGKHAVEPVDPGDVLARVVAMPIATWQWTAEPGRIRHMGPMAQDFKAAFGLGDTDKQIVTVDADGVALAAIQGLNTKLEAVRAAKDAEIADLRAELASIRALLARTAD
jgi:hypothetical protein